jgi:hypothetical protein
VERVKGEGLDKLGSSLFSVGKRDDREKYGTQELRKRNQ